MEIIANYWLEGIKSQRVATRRETMNKQANPKLSDLRKAAPESYEACKLALDWINWAMAVLTGIKHFPALEPPITELEQALAKAEGREE